MGDAILITTVVLSIATGILAFFGKLKFKHCKSACCESDCADSSRSRDVSRQNSRQALGDVGDSAVRAR